MLSLLEVAWLDYPAPGRLSNVASMLQYWKRAIGATNAQHFIFSQLELRNDILPWKVGRQNKDRASALRQPC
jgi:hypothetical protein